MRLEGLTHKSAMPVGLVLVVLLTGCGGWFEMNNMDHEEASTRLVELVDEALEAALQGSARPEPTGLGYHPCTDDRLGSTGEANPTYDYRFQYELSQDAGPRFADRAAEVWQDEGLEITAARDEPGLIERYAEGEGFNLSLTVNREIGQVHIGGSGPCVDPPEGAL
jgi:hypothetical protein